jgi:hypothetical protein
LARGSPSTSVASTTPSPHTSAKGSSFDLSGTNTLARDSHSTLVISTLENTLKMLLTHVHMC